MQNEQSTDDVISFLQHAGDRGMMPATTAQALIVASRNVFTVLNDAERKDVSALDLDDAIRRFTNKRAKEFNPSSLKEYGRRVRRAIDLFLGWRKDPATFKIKTRSANPAKDKPKPATKGDNTEPTQRLQVEEVVVGRAPTRYDNGGYETSFPLRAGQLVTLSNVPQDLTKPEAERLAAFVRMLAIG